MSEEAGVPDDLVKDARMNIAPAATSAAGALLRNAREAQGLHIAALAVTLKVPVKKLEALESDRYDLLHDMVFVRALALSVCRVLKVDAGAVMAALPQLQTPAIKTDAAGLNARFKSTEAGFRLVSVVRALNPAVLLMLTLVLAIIVIFLWPVKPAGDGFVQEVSPLGQHPAMTTDAQPEPATHHPPDTASQAAPVPTVVRSELAPASMPVAVVGASGSAAAGAMALASSALAGVSTESILTLQVRDASWIEVTDARDNLQLRKMAAAGEVLRVEGALPLSVVLGRADVVAVTVRGKPFDVTSFSKDNVARFEVK